MRFRLSFLLVAVMCCGLTLSQVLPKGDRADDAEPCKPVDPAKLPTCKPPAAIPGELADHVPTLYSCASPSGPVVYPDNSDVFPVNCTGFPTTDIFVFSGAFTRDVLPHMFSSTMLFMKCYRYFHIVIPRQELPWVIPFLPTNMPQLRIHDFDIPQAEEVCTRDSILKNRGTAWGFWKDIGQMVNLYADNFTAGADYIMQIDSDTVFNYPVRHPAALFGSKGPHLFHWQVDVPAAWHAHIFCLPVQPARQTYHWPERQPRNNSLLVRPVTANRCSNHQPLAVHRHNFVSEAPSAGDVGVLLDD